MLQYTRGQVPNVHSLNFWSYIVSKLRRRNHSIQSLGGKYVARVDHSINALGVRLELILVNIGYSSAKRTKSTIHIFIVLSV